MRLSAAWFFLFPTERVPIANSGLAFQPQPVLAVSRNSCAKPKILCVYFSCCFWHIRTQVTFGLPTVLTQTTDPTARGTLMLSPYHLSLADSASKLTLVSQGPGHTWSQLSPETVYIVIIALSVNWEHLFSQPINHKGGLFVFSCFSGNGKLCICPLEGKKERKSSSNRSNSQKIHCVSSIKNEIYSFFHSNLCICVLTHT